MKLEMLKLTCICTIQNKQHKFINQRHPVSKKIETFSIIIKELMLLVLGGTNKRVYPSLIFAMRALAIGKQRNTRDCKRSFFN